jgi:hypothetical protein
MNSVSLKESRAKVPTLHSFRAFSCIILQEPCIFYSQDKQSLLKPPQFQNRKGFEVI